MFSLKQLPTFYHKTELFNTLLENTYNINEKIILAKYVWDFKSIIKTKNEFNKLIESFKYFGVNQIDKNIVEIFVDIYLKCRKKKDIYELINIDELMHVFPKNHSSAITDIFLIIDTIYDMPQIDIMYLINMVSCNDIILKTQIVEILHSKRKICDELFLQMAALLNKIEWIDDTIKKNVEFDDIDVGFMLELATIGANIEVLKKLLNIYDSNNLKHRITLQNWNILFDTDEHYKCAELLRQNNFMVNIIEPGANNAFTDIFIEDNNKIFYDEFYNICTPNYGSYDSIDTLYDWDNTE